nr:hypothetical protein [Tanacetum cinerariifolium]
FFIIAVQTLGSGISILLAVGTPSTGSGNLYCQWELSPSSGNAFFQLDETQFILDANILRVALEITPIDQAYQFVSPSSGDEIIDFMNHLGYTQAIHFVSRMAVNNLYQPWRAILSMSINVSLATLLGMTDPDTQNVPYYNAYLEMVAKHHRKFAAKQGGKKKPATAKQPKPKHVKEKSSKPTLVPKPKASKKKLAKPSPAK